MSIVILIVGILLVRLLAKILESAHPLVRAAISTVLAVIIGIIMSNFDLNEYEVGDGVFDGIDFFLILPATLAIGTSLMAVTLGWESDGGYWNEYFRSGNTSYGRQEGDLGLMGMIIWAVIISGPIYLFLFAFNLSPVYIYFIFHAILFLKILFRK